MQSAAATSLVVPGVDDRARRWQAQKLGQIAFGATAVFTAQLYLSPGAWFPVLEPFRVALIIGVVALGALLLHRLLSNQPLWMGWRTAAFAVYASLALLSPLWTVDPNATARLSIEVAKHFLLFIAVVNTSTSPKRLRVALLLYAACAIVPGWGTFDNWRNDRLLVEGFRGRWYGVMGDPNHDAMSLIAAIPILLFFAVGRGHGWPKRILGVVGSAACIAGVIATHSRGGSLGLLTAVVVFALLSRRKALATAAVLVAAVSVLALAPKSFWTRNETIASYSEDLSSVGRLKAWDVAIRILYERPMTGVGTGAFVTAWNHYAPIDSDRLFGTHLAAHNLFMEIIGELGIVALAMMCILLIASVRSLWRARNGEVGGEARALLAAMIGYFVCQQFAGYSLNWFLYSMCAFATCCEVWGTKKEARAAPVAVSGSEPPGFSATGVAGV